MNKNKIFILALDGVPYTFLKKMNARRLIMTIISNDVELNLQDVEPQKNSDPHTMLMNRLFNVQEQFSRLERESDLISDW